jgi:hypothetical protein
LCTFQHCYADLQQPPAAQPTHVVRTRMYKPAAQCARESATQRDHCNNVPSFSCMPPGCEPAALPCCCCCSGGVALRTLALLLLLACCLQLTGADENRARGCVARSMLLSIDARSCMGTFADLLMQLWTTRCSSRCQPVRSLTSDTKGIDRNNSCGLRDGRCVSKSSTEDQVQGSWKEQV